MRIYNTLTRKVEEFKPIKPGQVKLYTCGPTVYDYAHLGNLRAYVFNDTLRRALELSDYKVKHVMNITDVGHLASDEDEGEDKLEKGANRENKSVHDVANFYIDSFLIDVKSLNILPPNGYKGPRGVYARATDFIDQQIDIVQRLLDKGYAYQKEQAIYFDVSKLDDYGKLNPQRLSDKEVAARAEVVTDQQKRHPQDFALWFFRLGRFSEHTLHWSSPWGDGFPGWHLECSAIIHATLGEPIDIHTGGVDHIGTHHTNEIAQTEAAFGLDLANYWVHNEHLLADGKKMSKSLQNFFTLQDVADKGYSPMALRLLFLQSHYRKQANFTWEALQAAAAHLKNIEAWADLKYQRETAEGEIDLEKIKSAILNDLNTPQALGLLSEIDTPPNQPTLEKLDHMLGLGLAKRSDIDEETKKLLKQRDVARRSDDWQKADSIRQKLTDKMLEIEDTPDGPIWRRV